MQPFRIEDCWNPGPDDRPTLAGILDRLEEMTFQTSHSVKSPKVESFVRAIKDQERKRGIEITVD
jgi:hypothetical protein